MKKNLKLSVVAIIAIMLSELVFPNHYVQPHTSGPAVVNYVWYKDEYLSEPTGTISDVDTEIDRLRILFPYSVFSSTFSMGLSEYEFGQYPNQSLAIIYSNR